MGCEHEYELGQIATDPWNTLQRIEYAYYFCTKCLHTVKRKVVFRQNAGDFPVSGLATSENVTLTQASPSDTTLLEGEK